MRTSFLITLAAVATAVSAAPAPLEKRATSAKLIETCTVPGTIALTFDDGPYEYTWALAETLKKEGVTATFFMNGQNWVDVNTQSVKTSAGTKTYKQVIKHVYDSGHQLASHTYSHLELGGQSATKVKSEMQKLEKIFRSIIGKNPTYMRPPAGSYDTTTLKTLGELGYTAILWDIDSNDWRYSDVSSLSHEQQNYKDVIENDSKTNPHGHIALHHDVYQKTAEKLVPWVISYIKGKKNYKFVSVAECLGKTKGSAYRTKA
ncbi:chitin deacetylase [Mucor lusitanicus]|uniref:Chitin deacetylase n=2 Tax=Mucor circinelloides f. lusitanicus TaxID=29924 RepID=A0A168MFC4_MUCCL|nr:chitin deacetylase [Mucor lusitanicus]OAD04848.1 chitin deacetylase [Mucor lusitanicus CBS 277.49]